MAAFERILCGHPQVDEILDNIRLGDNVVWQVTNLDEFRFFTEPYVRQAVKDGRDVIYIRFAQHEPVIQDLTGVDVLHFDPDEGFEAFTVAIHEEIARRGYDAFYVFDCLSELQSVWYTDLMMANFFRCTCPFLFILDTVAYFPVLRGRHSYESITRIRDTTQLFLDVYSNDSYLYLHPLKVWNRNSPRMFMPHAYKKSTGQFSTLRDGVGMSRYYQTVQKSAAKDEDQNIDSHDRFFNEAKREYQRGTFTEETEHQIIDSTMTKDPKLHDLVKKYFTPEDYFRLRDRMIGSGAIGGKACGVQLARRISEREIPEFAEHNEPDDSYFIGSDVFYTYIVYNGDWDLRIRQRSKEEYFSAAPELRERLLAGEFPPSVREQFRSMLDYFGQSPFIVRSSSFLEDGFGNAFAGKYESIFCVNQGSPEERMEALEQAVRRVYASTMDYSALEYRRQRGLDRRDEQMAILVQRVSGSYYGQYFMPGAAGVGYSHSAYKWYRDMDPNAGMLRIVMGLGTKAVDRTQEDYPRLANLDRPAATIYTTAEQRHRFSQRYIDVLDTQNNDLTEVSLDKLLPELPKAYKKTVLERDYDAESRLRQVGRWREVWFVSCQKLLENRAFTDLMQKILKTLERVYGTPVDIEYAINTDDDGEFVVNLLQCRPLYQGRAGQRVDVDQLNLKETFFAVKGSVMGSSGERPVDVIVQVDPVLYYNFAYSRKPEAAQAIGKINRYYAGKGQHLLLMTPGRIGTSSPELGVPVCFGEISNFSAICEVSETKAGHRPELSYGSHMFQDLVEAEIVYAAILRDASTLEYHENLFRDVPDRFAEICPDCPDLKDMITVREVEGYRYWVDSVSGYGIVGRQ